MTKRLSKALERYGELKTAYIQLHSHKIIAESPLPKKKALFHIRLYGQVYDKVTRLEREVDKLVSKLTAEELDQFDRDYFYIRTPNA